MLSLKSKSRRDLRVTTADSPRMIFFVFFPESPLGTGEPLNDVGVRKAINHAVDVDSIIANILAGQATRIAVLYAPQTYGFDPSIEPLAYDPELAKSLLAEAGYADGFTLDVDVPTGGNPIKPVEVGQAVAANLAEVGINVQMRTVDAATYTAMRNERNSHRCSCGTGWVSTATTSSGPTFILTHRFSSWPAGTNRSTN